MTAKNVNLEKLSPEMRKRVKQALEPKDGMMSMRFNRNKIAAWKKKAASEGMTLSEWVERAIDKAASK